VQEDQSLLQGFVMKAGLILLIGAVMVTGCYHPTEFFQPVPPSRPSGLYTETGDNFIELFWSENHENDVVGYHVYWSGQYDGRYELLATTRQAYFLDAGAVNGRTYYYAVTAFNADGMESELSTDVAYDVPRPEGYGVLLSDFRRAASTAGYSFGSYQVVRYDDQNADMYFEYFNGTYYMNVWSDTDIQDLGATSSLLDVRLAPATGWSPERSVPVVVGHTYVVWTWDDHYAKFRVTSVSPSRVVFDWAYQLQKSNPMLKRPVKAKRTIVPSLAQQ
jgi:hypothetical protein